jgi:flagellin-like hook-associated protein FlgL
MEYTMASTPILSTGVRQNLTSLQSIKQNQTQTENRLATGKKVNSALDNPVNYFTSAALNDRSGDLTNLLDGVQNSVQTLQAASNGIESITALVKNAQSAAKQALQTADGESDATLSGSVSDLKRSTSLISTTSGPGFTQGDTITLTSGTGTDSRAATFTIGSSAGQYATVGDLLKAINTSSLDVTATLTSDGEIALEETGGEDLAISSTGSTALTSMGFGSSNLTATASTSKTRDSFRQQFNDILDQIDSMAKDSGYNGINILMGNDLSTIFNEKTGTDQSKMTISGVVFNASGLGLEKLTEGDFQNNKQVNRILDTLTSALTTLRTQASNFGSTLSMVQAREDFTNNMVSTLNTGADQLVAADTNAESANLLALQTRQSLSTKALSLANQADQSVLQLFG